MISIVVDIDTIKKACENYESVYNHIDKLYRNKLEEYKNTKVKRKLFGFNIPWTQTTLYNQLGLDLYSTRRLDRPFLSKLKVMDEIRNSCCKTDKEHREFRDIQLDVIEYTERYSHYYTLSKLVNSGIQQIAVGYREQRFINEYIEKHNPFCN